MPLRTFLSPDAVAPALRANGKKQALHELSALAGRLVGRSAHEIFEPLLQRERLGSTGIGDGIAIPHCKLPRLERIFGYVARLERPIDFDLGFDLSCPQGQTLLSLTQYLRTELSRPGGLVTMPMARDQLESLVLTQLLLTIPNNYTELLMQPGWPAPPSKVRKAIDLIEADPGADLSLAELSAAAGVTSRQLQRAFNEAVGMSPMAYVRAVRLDRVHADLLDGAGSTPVTEVAMRWGFFHLSRFAQQYRERFGVLPSETVRQALRKGR